MEKTKLLLAMSITATMVCQSLMAQNEATASEQKNESVQYLIIDKTDSKIGLLEDTIELSYVYKNVVLDEATHEMCTIKHSDTTLVQIINIYTRKVIAEDIYVRDSLIYNRLYNEAGDSVQVTSYKNNLAVKHYQQGRLVRQYKYKGNKRYAVLCYPEGSIMCTYTTDADIQYYTRTGLKTKVTKPLRLVSDSLLRKALTRMLVQNEESFLPKDYSIEIKIDAKGHMTGWRNIAERNNSSREFQNWAIPFVWEPANLEGFEIIGYDTISISEKDFNTLQYGNGLTFPQLPQDGDLFYANIASTSISAVYNPFILEKDTAQYTWSANLRLEPNGKKYETAIVKRNGNSIYFEWTSLDGKKFKEEKYAVLDLHTLLLEKEVYFDHDAFTRINQFDQGEFISSVRLDAKGDTISVWKELEKGQYLSYTYNINPYIKFITQTGSERNIEYRDKTRQNIVRPRIKDPSRCYIVIPDSLKNMNAVITGNNGDYRHELRYTIDGHIILYAYAMIGENGAPIDDYELGFKSIYDWNYSPSSRADISFIDAMLVAKMKDVVVPRKKQILQYVQDELSKSPIEFIPGRIDSNVIALPYVFTLTLVTDSSEIPTSLPTEKASSEDEPVFVLAEKMPEFPGGQQALFKYLSENVNYPSAAQKHRFQGRTICQFVVNTDGSIVDIEVVHSSGHPLLDQEAIRVIESMPKWEPGRHDGKPVRVKFTVPINFHL